MLTSVVPDESAELKYNEVKIKDLIDSIDDFNNASYQKQESFKSQYDFLNSMASDLIDLNQSNRKEIWICTSMLFVMLYLFSFFNCIN